MFINSSVSVHYAACMLSIYLSASALFFLLDTVDYFSRLSFASKKPDISSDDPKLKHTLSSLCMGSVKLGFFLFLISNHTDQNQTKRLDIYRIVSGYSVYILPVSNGVYNKQGKVD